MLHLAHNTMITKNTGFLEVKTAVYRISFCYDKTGKSAKTGLHGTESTRHLKYACRMTEEESSSIQTSESVDKRAPHGLHQAYMVMWFQVY